MNTQQPTVIRATGPADFLATIPAMIGYTPRQSVVVIPFADSRSLGVMRFDLPTEDASLPQVASTIIGLAIRVGGATRIATVIYTDQDGETGRPFVAAILDRAAECGIGITDALYVASDGWGSLLTGDGPHPLTEIGHDLADAHGAHGDQRTGIEIPDADPDRLEAVSAALEAFDLHDAAETDYIEIFEHAVNTDAGEIDPHDAAALIFALSRPAYRDVALVQWSRTIDTGRRALTAQHDWESGTEYPTDLASIMWGEGERPEATRLLAGLDLARHLAPLTPAPIRPGILATAAWLSWALGRSTHADAYATQALAIDNGHGLSEIVASFVQAGHLPSWAFTR